MAGNSLQCGASLRTLASIYDRVRPTAHEPTLDSTSLSHKHGAALSPLLSLIAVAHKALLVAPQALSAVMYSDKAQLKRGL